VAAGLALLLAGGALRAETHPPLVLDYDVYLGGFHARSFQAQVSLGKEAYQARVRSNGDDGLLAKWFDFAMEAEADGRTGKAGLLPRRFHVANTWFGGGQRRVEIAYATDGAAEVRVEPPPEEDDRDAVPLTQRRGTLDPISAILMLVWQLAENSRCDGEVAVFDGRRRYDVTTQGLGGTRLEASDSAPYSGPAVVCRVTFRPIAGFWRNARRDGSKSPEIDVFLAPGTDLTPPLPVRLHAKNRFGALRIHLVAARPANAGLNIPQ